MILWYIRAMLTFQPLETFNQFFYRKLKPNARPIADPEDPRRLVSCADCRMMAFETVSEATRIWIKGREFSVARLLGPEYENDIHKFEGGALGIFRCANLAHWNLPRL